MPKFIQCECLSCGRFCVLGTVHPEHVQFCPFCGDEYTVPFGDADNETFDDDEARRDEEEDDDLDD